MNVMITGAWSYLGGRIAARLLETNDNHKLWSLTTSGPVATGLMPDNTRDPWGGQITPEKPRAEQKNPERWNKTHLQELFEQYKTDVLVSTYWPRHDNRPRERGSPTPYEVATANSLAMIDAAYGADVKAVIWTSVTNPGGGGNLPYFQGKIHTENAVRRTFARRSWSVLRPAWIFGSGGPPQGSPLSGSVIENIAWACRKTFVIPIPHGMCRVRPIHVDDYARLVAQEVAYTTRGDRRAITRDACGTERTTLRAIIERIGDLTGHQPLLIQNIDPRWCRRFYEFGNWLWQETIVSENEMEALRRGLYDSNEEPAATADPQVGHPTTELDHWLLNHAHEIGAALVRTRKRL